MPAAPWPWEQAFDRVLSVPLLGGVRGGFMIPMRDSGIVKARHERGSAVVERNRFRADQMNAAVDRGQIYRRAAFAEFAVEVLSDRKMFFRLE